MNYSKNELTVLCAALLAAPTGEPVRVARLVKLFNRPKTLLSAIDKLRLAHIIVFDPYQDVLRVLAKPAWEVLNQFGMTEELFTQQRPLDEVMAHISRCQLQGEMPSQREPSETETHYSLPKPPEPPKPKPPTGGMARGIVSAAGKAPLSIRLRALCLAGKMEEEKLRLPMEVAKLDKREPAAMLDEILRYDTTITDKHLEHWYWRITSEDAEMVQAALDELRLQLPHVKKTKIGFLNRIYMNGVGAGQSAPTAVRGGNSKNQISNFKRKLNL